MLKKALFLAAAMATISGCTTFGHGAASEKCNKDSQGAGCASFTEVLEMTDSDAYRENIREYRERNFSEDGEGKESAEADKGGTTAARRTHWCRTDRVGHVSCRPNDAPVGEKVAVESDAEDFSKVSLPAIGYASSGLIKPRHSLAIWVAPYVDQNGFYNKSSVIEVEIKLDPQEIWNTENVIDGSSTLFQPLKIQ